MGAAPKRPSPEDAGTWQTGNGLPSQIPHLATPPPDPRQWAEPEPGKVRTEYISWLLDAACKNTGLQVREAREGGRGRGGEGAGGTGLRKGLAGAAQNRSQGPYPGTASQLVHKCNVPDTMSMGWGCHAGHHLHRHNCQRAAP